MPIGLISGDDACIEENRPLFRDAEFVRVKRALGHRSARSLGIAAARTVIRTVAEPRDPARRRDPPVRDRADLVETVPVSRRLDATRVAFPVTSMADAIRCINTASAMSAIVA